MPVFTALCLPSIIKSFPSNASDTLTIAELQNESYPILTVNIGAPNPETRQRKLIVFAPIRLLGEGCIIGHFFPAPG